MRQSELLAVAGLCSFFVFSFFHAPNVLLSFCFLKALNKLSIFITYEIPFITKIHDFIRLFPSSGTNENSWLN